MAEEAEVIEEAAPITEEAEVEVEASPEPESEPSTALEDPGDEKEVAAPVDWPSDWREKLAGEDEKQAKYLGRFASPQAYHESLTKEHTKLRSIISKANIKPDFPSDGSEEDQAAWRKEVGLPESSDKYLEDYDLGDGIVLGEGHKEIADMYMKSAFARNETPESVKANLKDYLAIEDFRNEQRQAQDEEEKTSTRDELRDEFGADFQRNLGAAFGLLDQAPADVKEAMLGARLGGGRALGNDPGVLRWLTQLALDINPAATVVPGGNSDSAATIKEELAKIETIMSKDRNTYFRDETMQKRYAELTEAQQKLDARGK